MVPHHASANMTYIHTCNIDQEVVIFYASYNHIISNPQNITIATARERAYISRTQLNSAELVAESRARRVLKQLYPRAHQEAKKAFNDDQQN